uniref:Uncharacterized protein n=1 Tax=Rhizophora mucronata TaxID=61149 RepID=A0A2P2IQM9_RHIMU
MQPPDMRQATHKLKTLLGITPFKHDLPRREFSNIIPPQLQEEKTFRALHLMSQGNSNVLLFVTNWINKMCPRLTSRRKKCAPYDTKHF